MILVIEKKKSFLRKLLFIKKNGKSVTFLKSYKTKFNV
jgi:hypothetical protein